MGESDPVEAPAREVRELGERLREAERQRAEQLVLQIAQSVAATTGAGFFHSLVEHLAQALQADCSLVGELLPGAPSRIGTLAVFLDGRLPPNFEYDLADTPCASVIGRRLCIYPSGVRELFPRDSLLVEMGIEAYAGMPLFASQGRPLGHIAVLFRRPLSESGLVRSMLEIFAARASAELERSQAEQALRKSEQRFRAFIAHTTECVWCVEFEQPIPAGLPAGQLRERIYRHGYIAECNDVYARLRGFPSAAEAAGAPLRAFITPEEWQVLSHSLPTDCAGRDTCVVSAVDAQGRRRRFLRSRTVVVANDLIEQMWGLMVDITDRAEAEEALRESESRFRELLENVRLIAVMLDTGGNITFCNDSLLRLTGWSAAEVVGRNWFDLFLPENVRDEVKRMFASGVANADLPVHYENSILTRDRALRLVAWDNTLLRSPEGRILGSASVGRDVTEQRSLEERSRQAQRLESVGRLAGGVAHDFNNLLTVINGYSELLLQRADPLDPIRASLAEIYNAGQRAAGLTQQLLAFSRRQVLKPEMLDLNVVVADSGKMLRRLIGEDIEIIIRPDPSLASVRADAGQMHQVLMNLAVNARDAMPLGGRLTIETANIRVGESAIPPEPGLAPGDYALLTVGDTGPGLTREAQEHMFEPFFTTKKPGKGTGLGLSTVYGIVEQSGGRISVYSAPGQGATFRIYLPAIRQPPAPPDGGPPAGLADLRGTETILLVEDQADVRRLAASLLTGLGYRVLAAANGNEALALAQHPPAPIELLLTDVIMPGMTGFELASRLATIHPDIPVLYMSGYADRVPAPQDASAWPAHFIDKPFRPVALAAKIRESLKHPGPPERK